MADISIVSRKLAKIEMLALDASIDESHKYPSKVTSYPVEDGSTITDFILNEPIQLTITGFVTNASILHIQPTAEYASGYSLQEMDRVSWAYKYLMDIRAKRQPVSIVTALSNYENMALVNLTIPRDKTIGEALKFTADFKQIRRVDSITTPATYIKSVQGAHKQGVDRNDRGRVEPKKEKEGTPLYNAGKVIYNTVRIAP